MVLSTHNLSHTSVSNRSTGDEVPAADLKTQRQYLAEWAAWAEDPAASGTGESRGVAAARMATCLAESAGQLDLRGLGLCSLPASLPPEITELVVADNQLTELPALPAGLTHLDASSNRLTALPPLPAGLIWRDVTDNPLDISAPDDPATAEEDTPVALRRDVPCERANIVSQPAAEASASAVADRRADPEEDTRLLLTLTEWLIRQVAERLMESALKQGEALAGEYMRLSRQIAQLYHSPSQSLPARLMQIKHLIESHKDDVPGCIGELLPWIDLALDAGSVGEGVWGGGREKNICTLLDTTQTLLASPLLADLLPPQQVTRFRTLLQQGAQAGTLLTTFRQLPADAPFSAYFDLLRADPLLCHIAPGSLTSLAELAEQLHRTADSLTALPARKDGEGPVSWLMKVLSDDNGIALLAPHVDPGVLRAVKTPAALVKLFQAYPAEEDGLAQLVWLVEQLSSEPAHSPLAGTLLAPVITQWRDSLADSHEIMRVTHLLIALANPNADRRKPLAELLGLIFTSQRVAGAAAWFMPSVGYFSAAMRLGEKVCHLSDWYHQIGPDQSWQTLSQQFAQKTSALLKEDSSLLASLSGISAGSIQATGSAVDALLNIQQMWSWEQTTGWLMKQVKQHPQGRWYYDRMLEACISWQLWQAFKPGLGSEQAGASLQHAALLLKSYLPGVNTATFDIVLQVLPLLPGLVALKNEGHALPAAQGWTAWLQDVVRLAGNSTRPEIQRLVGDVDSLAHHIGSDMLQRLFTGLTDSAASLFGEEPGVNEIADTLSGASTLQRADTAGAEQLMTTMLADAGRAGSHRLGQQLGKALTSAGQTLNDILLQGNRRSLNTSSFRSLRLSPLFNLFIPASLRLTAENSAVGSVSSQEEMIIWGDEALAREKKYVTVGLAVYFLSIIAACAAYKVYKAKGARDQGAGYRPADQNDVAIPMVPMAPASTDPAPAVSTNLLSEQKTDANEQDNSRSLTQPLKNSVGGTLGQVWQRMKDNPEEPALGVGLLVGLGATAYVVNKYAFNKQEVTLDEVVERVSFIDVASDKAFAAAFEIDPTATSASRQRRSAPVGNPQDKVREYLAALTTELSENPPLQQFFEHLTAKLLPTLFIEPGLMSKTDNDYALLLQLDRMFLTMQAFIIEQVYKYNYTNFRGLLSLNQVRNFVISALLKNHKSQVTAYYQAIAEGGDFKKGQNFLAGGYAQNLPALCVA